MAKKRVNGEGTIGKRKDGRWEARYIAGRDPETGKVLLDKKGQPIMEDYEVEVEVPYTYTICTVTLKNRNLSHIPVEILGEDGLSMYAT